MTNSDEPEGAAPEQAVAPSPVKQPASSHDTLFYWTFSDPQRAAAELRAVLPPEISAEIDWEGLERETNRFTDGNLTNHFTDILLRAKIRRSKLYLHLLFEHSSHAKPLELLQTLRYQVRKWEQEAQASAKGQDESGNRLSPILTIILHHSETGWRGRTRFMDYFGLDPDIARMLSRYVVDFGIVLDDISKVNTEALVERPVPPEVQVMLFALRFGRTGRRALEELPKLAPQVAALWQREQGRLVVGLFFLYMKRVAKVSDAEIRMALQDVLEPELDQEMVALWEQFEAGERKGKLEGKLDTLQRQLVQRFGPLSASAVAFLQSATMPALDAMTLRVLTATSVDEVLGKR